MKRRQTGSAAVDAELQAIEADFNQWRKARPHLRAPFPLALLERAHALAIRLPKVGVYHLLKLDGDKVAARVRAAGGTTRKARRPSKRGTAPRPTFVELPFSSASATPVVITIDRGGGVRFRIEIDQDHLGDAARIVAGFIGSMP